MFLLFLLLRFLWQELLSLSLLLSWRFCCHSFFLPKWLFHTTLLLLLLYLIGLMKMAWIPTLKWSPQVDFLHCVLHCKTHFKIKYKTAHRSKARGIPIVFSNWVSSTTNLLNPFGGAQIVGQKLCYSSSLTILQFFWYSSLNRSEEKTAKCAVSLYHVEPLAFADTDRPLVSALFQGRDSAFQQSSPSCFHGFPRQSPPRCTGVQTDDLGVCFDYVFTSSPPPEDSIRGFSRPAGRKMLAWAGFVWSIPPIL